MESRFDADNLPKIRFKGSMVKPCWLLIEKQELADKETGTGKKSTFPEINCHWKLSLTSFSAISIEVSCDLS